MIYLKFKQKIIKIIFYLVFFFSKIHPMNPPNEPHSKLTPLTHDTNPRH